MDFEEIIENLNENEIYIEDEVSNKKQLIKYIKEYLVYNDVYFLLSIRESRIR